MTDGNESGSDATAKNATATSKTWKGVDQWEPSWGERQTKIKRPTVYILDLKSLSVKKFEGMPEEHSCGQPVWTPDDTGIVFTGWSHIQTNFKDAALKLGFLHCYNRPCTLFYMSLEGLTDASKKAIPLTSGLLSAYCPAFSSKGHRLTFISCEHAAQTGVHSSTERLYCFDWNKVRVQS